MWRYAYSSEDDTKPQISWRLIQRVLAYARPYRTLIVIGLILILIQSGLGLLTPLIFRDLIDHTLPSGDTQRLDLLAFGLILIPVFSSIIGVIIRRVNARVGEGVIYDLRVSLFSHLQRMSLRFFTNTKSGELMSRLNNDVVNAQSAISDNIVGIVTNVVQLVATLGIMLTLDWRLTILGIAVFPLFILSARAIGVKLRVIAREAMDLNAEMNAMIAETLNISGALLVKLFGRRAQETDRFANRAGRVRDIGVERAVLGSQFWAILGGVSVIGTALVYWVGGHLVLSGVFTIGTIVAFAAYLGQLYGPMQYLIDAPIEFSASMVSFERVFEIIDLPEEIAEKPNAIQLHNVSGRLVFEDVTFRYERSESGLLSEVHRYGRIDNVKAVLSGSESKPASGEGKSSQARETALEHLSFEIEPGQLVALVGPSGAGKTTLTYLIPRLYDPTSGRITLDGHDLRDVTLASLTDAVGMVTQETYLFHDTILTNLLYAKVEATQAQVEAACQAANIHDFIMDMPDGYNTIVGERGYRLSGGEKQRLALARVILKDPRVLVLDEATSHLDSQSEALIQDALEKIMVQRTSIVIAHRLSTILAADQILVMDRGQIVERGTHETLLAQGGLYAQLYETQFRSQREIAPEVDAE
ncbi:MAG TPA: ABC transporter ATP-binding protein [Phototrophicaceae bacterium]|nr:ABC transporter ATP-binding protein [Phototrophicaceae bacterium]